MSADRRRSSASEGAAAPPLEMGSQVPVDRAVAAGRPAAPGVSRRPLRRRAGDVWGADAGRCSVELMADVREQVRRYGGEVQTLGTPVVSVRDGYTGVDVPVSLERPDGIGRPTSCSVGSHPSRREGPPNSGGHAVPWLDLSEFQPSECCSPADRVSGNRVRSGTRASLRFGAAPIVRRPTVARERYVGGCSAWWSASVITAAASH